MKNRICNPILFQLFHGQALKKFFLAQEIRFKRRYQQTFSKTTGTAQEIITACLHHLINQSSLINIEITVCPDFFKVLYANGVYLATHTLLKLFKLQCNYAYVSLEITQSAIVRVSALKFIATFTTGSPQRAKRSAYCCKSICFMAVFAF